MKAVIDEVLGNHFRAVAEEMSHIVLRAAHTTFVKETQDYAAALVTPDGEVFSYPRTTGVTSLMGIPMRPGTSAFDDWAEGDVMITNDPFHTSGMVMHLPDLYLMKPVFAEGELICFLWAFIHCSDIGGAVPGSTEMTSHEVFQEGVRFRPVKLYKKGEFNRELWNIIADNCRIPDLNRGDIGALIAAFNTGEKRLKRLVEKFGLDPVKTAIRTTIDRTEQRARAILREIRAGSYGFVDYLEDDYVSDTPIRIEVTLKSDGEGQVILDFTGSSPQVRAALNMPTGGQRHHPFPSVALLNFIATRAEGLLLNAGMLRPIELVLPENSVVNAGFPAAMGMRYLTAMRAHDATLGALAAATGAAVPAAGAGEIAVTLLATRDIATGGINVAVANPVQGGTGGGPHLDGVSGIDYPVSFLRNVPAEVLESEMPVLVREFSLLPDSEGAGRFRGGFGVEYAFETDHPEATIVMRGKERYRFQPWGSAGGRAGSLGRTVVTGPDGKTTDIGKASTYRPRPGEVLRMRGAGGGGYGSPLDRDPALVLRDVTDELVSGERARTVYGVVIADGAVDVEATGTLRAEMKAGADGPGALFDFGPAREAWRRAYGDADDVIADWLGRLPAGLRTFAKEAAWNALRAGKDDQPSRETVAALVKELERQFTERELL